MATAKKKVQKYKDIVYTVMDQVAWVTINRPHVLNACRELTLDEIAEAIRSTRDDPSIACVVVTGAGDRAFCSGGDFTSMMRLNWVVASHWNERMLNCAMTIRGVSIPVIAMVNGWCMGGGNELALWCDVVVASDNAVFGQTGAKVGACPTVGATQYLPRIIGERLAREMIFCARRFTAREAVDIGLANHCVPLSELRNKTLELCEEIKSHSPQTLRMTKVSLNHESDNLYASWRAGMELLAHVWGSDESLEGMRAFVEKRKPDFNQFRLQNKDMVEAYLAGMDRGDEDHLK
jgi:dihydroxynaphthoic acid synthetase